MGLLDRFSKRGNGSLDRGASKDDERHLREFVQTRAGVEAYVEPQTNVTSMTVVLVAADGEWTRRRVVYEQAMRKLGEKWKIPVYDAARTGYPQRMRDWSARNRT